MVNTRAKKVENIANDIPPQKLDGPATGDLLVLSWGGTYGACATAVHNVQAKGKNVTHCHLRYLNPLPKELGNILSRFKKVLIPELNMGQLKTVIRARYLVDAIGLNKVQGKPFSVAEVVEKIESLLKGDTQDSQAQPEPIDGDTTVKAVLESVAHGG
jgi:2-oxoglutarate ferredoxin oxidoreductase subunit alpha